MVAVLPAERPATALATIQVSRPQKFARVALATALIGLGGWTLHSYLPALAWAGVLAIATWPLYQRVQRRWPPRRRNVLVPALFTAVVALLFIGPLALVVVQLSNEIHNAAVWVHQARTSGIPAPDWLKRVPFASEQATSWWQANLTDPHASADLLERMDRGRLVSESQRLGSIVLHRAVVFGFTLLTLFFLFRDGGELTRQMLAASRRAFGSSGERIGRQIVASVRGTVDGLVLVGLGEGILLGVAYSIAGVPHAALLGALSAMAAMVPFGAPLIFCVAALLLFVKGATTAAVALLVFGMAVTFAADHAIRPVLIGGATRLPFLWVLLGILGGVETWGLLGLFLGPAIMAALILLWREWTEGAAA